VLPRAFARKPAFVQRFYTESMALSGLNHPHIVSIIDRGHVGDTYFFVMEHVDGPSLESIMGRPVSAELFVSIAKQVTAGLEYAHARDIVHRDIKPSNIMVNSQQEVKIADFGLAGVIHEQRRWRPRARAAPAWARPPT